MATNGLDGCLVTYNPTNYTNIGVRITLDGYFVEGPMNMEPVVLTVRCVVA